MILTLYCLTQPFNGRNINHSESIKFNKWDVLFKLFIVKMIIILLKYVLDLKNIFSYFKIRKKIQVFPHDTNDFRL